MKSTILRLTLAAGLALSGLTACSKKPDGTGSSETENNKKLKKDGTKKKLKKDGTKKEKKEKKPKDPVAPAAPAPPVP